MELYAYVSLGYLLPAFLTLLVSPKSVTKMRSFFQLSVFSKLILMCILYTIASITFFLALQMNANSSQTTSISLLSVIITVILSALFLKERDHLPRKIIGAILSILGSIILIK
jgi:uncharacterized membrane protein